METVLEVRRLSVAELIPAQYNPRRAVKASDKAYRKLRAGLESFGLVEPLVWNADTGHIVGGHLRLQILRELGVTEVPVSVVRLSAEREKALNILLNNQEAQGRFDGTKLAALLTELEELPEAKLTGFDPTMLRNLRMEPTAMEPLAEAMPTLTLEIPLPQFEEVSSRVDTIVREYDLTCHVRGLPCG